jgi:hypothetical protein
MKFNSEISDFVHNEINAEFMTNYIMISTFMGFYA